MEVGSRPGVEAYRGPWCVVGVVGAGVTGGGWAAGSAMAMGREVLRFRKEPSTAACGRGADKNAKFLALLSSWTPPGLYKLQATGQELALLWTSSSGEFQFQVAARAVRCPRTGSQSGTRLRLMKRAKISSESRPRNLPSKTSDVLS